MDVKKALTLGELARQLDCPIHRIKYLVQARRIEHVARAGNLRIFGPEVLNLLRAELDRRTVDHRTVFASGAGGKEQT